MYNSLLNRIFRQKKTFQSHAPVWREVINSRANEEIGFRTALILPNVNTRSSGARRQIDLRSFNGTVARLRVVVARMDNGRDDASL